MMLINGFLGEVVGLESVLNEFSYNIALYGEPDLARARGAGSCSATTARSTAWSSRAGWCVSPVFLGAEPDEIDEGPHAGLRRRLRRPHRARHRADGRPPAGPAAAPPPSTSRWSTRRCRPAGCTPATSGTSPARSRTTGSSRSRASAWPSMPAAAQQTGAGDRRGVRPAAARRPARGPDARDRGAPRRDVVLLDRRARARATSSTTALQSPVIIAELDHHCGVFLDYDTPQPFHIHTVLRTPHGNDYGRAWVRQWQDGARHELSRPSERRRVDDGTRSSFGGHRQQCSATGVHARRSADAGDAAGCGHRERRRRVHARTASRGRGSSAGDADGRGSTGWRSRSARPRRAATTWSRSAQPARLPQPGCRHVAVAGPCEPPLCRARPVAVDARAASTERTSPRLGTGGISQLAAGDGGEQAPVGVSDRQGQRAVGRAPAARPGTSASRRSSSSRASAAVTGSPSTSTGPGPRPALRRPRTPACRARRRPRRGRSPRAAPAQGRSTRSCSTALRS